MKLNQAICQNAKPKDTPSFSLVIHGGAWSSFEILRASPETYVNNLKLLLEGARQMLSNGASALDVVEYCVRQEEDDPLHNAGRGSIPKKIDFYQMDAAIMEGATLSCGAVAGVQNVKNPISLARLVMEKTNHVLLVDQGAMDFARTQNVDIMPDTYFDILFLKDNQEKHGTVGAVVRDMHGNLAAGTSTGGVFGQIPGRVGDTPLIGAGTYANNQTCAISCTGVGEDFIRATLSHRVSMLMEIAHMPLQDSMENSMAYLRDRTNGSGGMIGVDRAGKVCSAAHDTSMLHGWIEQGGRAEVSWEPSVSV
ncbi:MAG: isoaspartyl peptidase/L-asparaginase [Rhodospirillales bacterium]|nr:isoaspartyl peptidase/L-asparaginase [Rhodospirillales bacterium]MCB9965337.1 isoaspartyl peptidase/L-asparaginase [Rhodospirillales bacterium]